MDLKNCIKSYVYTEKGNFFVSTIYRESSALEYESWYYETFAWELDETMQRKDNIIADNSGAVTQELAIKQHYDVVEQLYKVGNFTK